MPSDFDEMSEKAHVHYQVGSKASRDLRDLLQATMKENGFLGISNEWWHFNHHTFAEHPVLNLTFDQILKAISAQAR